MIDVAPYVNRLFDDEAVQDQKLMDHVTGAARSLPQAIGGLTNQPPPKPKRRRTVVLLGTALAVGAAAAWIDQQSSSPAKRSLLMLSSMWKRRRTRFMRRPDRASVSPRPAPCRSARAALWRTRRVAALPRALPIA